MISGRLRCREPAPTGLTRRRGTWRGARLAAIAAGLAASDPRLARLLADDGSRRRPGHSGLATRMLLVAASVALVAMFPLIAIAAMIGPPGLAPTAALTGIAGMTVLAAHLVRHQ